MDFRMRYYNSLVGKISDPSSINTVPEHLVPAELYHVHTDDGDAEAPGDGKQSSLMTIFSVWNTMIGSSLMAMPWGFYHAGLIGGITMCLVVGFISWYTCWLILKLSSTHRDLFELCQEYLGSPGRWISWIFALLFAVGILVSYEIIMTTALVDVVEGFREFANHGHPTTNSHYWNKYIAASIVGVLVFAVSILSRYYRVMVRINTWALILLIYIIIYFLGMAMNQGAKTVPSNALFKPHFAWLSGILTASFLLHNAIINIMKVQRHPENNMRDLTIGYGLAVFTYLLVGSVCFVCFRHSELALRFPNGVLPQDFLQIFPKTNIGAIVARFALFFYTLSAYPLLCTIVRIQFFGMVWDSQFPGWIHVLALNLFIVVVGTVFASLLPQLADVLRFVGAFAGAVLVSVLPSLMYWRYLKDNPRYSRLYKVVHMIPAVVLVLGGIGLIVAQFL